MTKEQCSFIEGFIKLSKTSRANAKEDEIKTAKEVNLEKVSIEDMSQLLKKHPDLDRSAPFMNSRDDGDYLDGHLLMAAIDEYLEQTGMSDYFKHDINDSYYAITYKGTEALEGYKIELQSKRHFPLASIIVAIVAAAISVASLVITLVNLFVQ